MKDTNNININIKKLNLGCGFDNREGYLNIDLNGFHKPDLIADICNLGMLSSDFYDEIIAQDVLEHIPRTKTKSVLAEWNRLLKIGGTLKLRVPNLLALLSLLEGRENQNARKQEEILQYLFGTQKYNGDFHHIAFTELLLKDYLTTTGFTILNISHKDKWLFDVIAQKVEDSTYEDFFVIYKDLLAVPKKHEFLVEAYLNILGREPDKEGFDYYLSMLDNSRMNKEALIETLLKLHEIEKRTREELLAAHADLLAIPNDSDFLVKAYLDILGRDPDKEGFDHYISMLDIGKMSKEVVVASLSNLKVIERRARDELLTTYADLLVIPNNSEFLVKAYLDILGRDPDKEGFDHYISMLDIGKMSKEVVVASLSNLKVIERRARDELLTTYADLLVIPNNSEFLVKAYLDILGRDPDTEGFNHYFSMLDSGKMSKKVVVTSLSNMREIEKLARDELLTTYADLLAIPNDSDFLVKAYLDILGREPDKEGFDYYTSMLDDDKISREIIIELLIISDEM